MQFNEKNKKKKLMEIFEQLPEEKRLLVEGLVFNASFMIVELEKLQKVISESGETEAYLHGKGQSGRIMSADTKAYVNLQKTYLSTINSLVKLLPKESADKDELMSWLRDNNGI